MLAVLAVVTLISSLLLIHIGAKKTLQGAVRISQILRVSRITIGTTLVASITVLPEFMSSVVAAAWGHSHLALGNILGSNIYNVPLMIGLCGLIKGFKIKDSVAIECALLISLSLLLSALLIVIKEATTWMGIVFIASYLLFIGLTLRKPGGEHVEEKNPSSKGSVIHLALGALFLLIGTMLLVRSALLIADLYGLKEFYVGLVIVSIGSIIPEVAVSLSAAVAGAHEISIGNVVGDNIITTTLVFGSVAVIRPFRVSVYEILTTVPFIILVTVILSIMSGKGQRVAKPLSIAMLSAALLILVVQTMFLPLYV